MVEREGWIRGEDCEKCEGRRGRASRRKAKEGASRRKEKEGGKGEDLLEHRVVVEDDGHHTKVP